MRVLELDPDQGAVIVDDAAIWQAKSRFGIGRGKAAMLAAVLGACFLLSACNSIGVGVGIPGTPLSVGASMPIPGTESKSAGANTRGGDAAFRMVHVDSLPTGAEIFVNGDRVGTTPMDVALPFPKGWFGSAKGVVNLVVQKQNFPPVGTAVFPKSAPFVSLTPDGPAINQIQLQLTAQ